jgi:TolB-like protein/DNA-binding winged helix-turn-helix (wHTH) protein
VSRLLRFDGVEIDLQTFRLKKSGETLQIEPKSLKVLIFLAQSGGRLVGRQELIDSVWGDSFVTDHVLSRAIGQLRRVLDEDPKKPRYIETVPTLGYRFIAELDGTTGSTEAQLGVPRIGKPEVEPSLAAALTASSMRVLFRIVAVPAALLLALVVVFSVRMTRTRAAAGQIRSLAVLPLKNLSGDPAQYYLADGMTEQLITDLGQIGALTVISPTTAMQYRDTHKSLPQIAADLHVEAVVEGSVARAGDQLRIDAQLIDARADRQLWARSFQGTLSDAFTLQNQVASAVADEIRIQLTPQERTQLATSATTNPQAYQDLLLGHYFEENNTPDDERKALQYYQQAARLDPNFARAYVGIALAYNFLADADAIPTGEATTAADSALARALDLDPNLAEAYGERGWMEMFYHWDMAGAARDFRHASEIDPSDATFHQGIGQYLMHVGRFDEAFHEFDRSMQLDPLSRRDHVDYCNMLMFAKRYDDAFRQCNAALEMDPHFEFALMILQELDERTGNYTAAHELVKKLGWCYDDLCMAANDEIHGRPGTTGAWDAWTKTQHPPPDAPDTAMADTALRRNDQAFANLEKAYEQHRNMQFLTFLPIDPFFAPLYSDPRFDAFLKHAGLPPRSQAGDNQKSSTLK